MAILTGSNGHEILNGTEENDTINALDGDDTLYGIGGNDILNAGNGNDSVYGGNGNDTITGASGNDSLLGDAGHDILDGGTGNDTLYGGDGSDTYKFGFGYGQDTIYNYDYDAVGTYNDTILLGAGITTSNVKLTRQSDDLIINLVGRDDTLRVQSYFNTDGASAYRVENIKFADGTIWNVGTVKTLVQESTVGDDTLYGYAVADNINGGDGDDVIYGYGSNDTLNGGNGNDTLNGGDGNDTLAANTGNDTVYGGNGNDTITGASGNDYLLGDAGHDILDGGIGNDYLSGGDGSDTYKFGFGYGQDTIYNYDSDAVGTYNDTILLGTGITTAGVKLTRQSDDLIINLGGRDDTLRVQSYFNTDGASAYRVENIQFADGTIWNVGTVKSLVQQGTTGGDALYGYAIADTLNGGDGDDIIYGYGSNDTLDGGNGNDTLNGGDGNDTLAGNTGNDTVYGGAGNDTITGASGSDTLYGDAGSDTLDGSIGNDYLSGGDGGDTYKFGFGYGQDIVYNYDYDAIGANSDTILLGTGITTTGVKLTRQSDDLIINLVGRDDTLRVQSYFYNDGASAYRIENIQFADGTIWNVGTVKGLVQQGNSDDNTLYGYATADTLNGFDGDDTLFGYGSSDTLNGGNGNDTLYGGDGSDRLQGNTGNDYVYGGTGNDWITGASGTDTLYGDAGNDILNGGIGNDYLSGGDGADTYQFGFEYGQDTIYNYDYDAVDTNADTILLGTGISTTGVKLTRQADDLVINLVGRDDTLRVQSYFYNDGASGYVVENIQFADGTIWDFATVTSNLDTTPVPASVTIYGTTASETLTAGAGNDTIYGNSGNDTLKGGTGNDTLSGDAGNDTFVFNRGDGKDTIYAYDSTVGKVDAVQLGAGIATTDVTLTRESDDLLISLNNSSDSVRVQNYFYSDAAYGYQVEQINFADGTSWNVNTVKTKVTVGTNYNDTLYGYDTADTLSGGFGFDTLYGRGGNDTIDGGDSDDTLYGEDGNDLLKGGNQDDQLNGGNGADTLQGQQGNDTLYGGAGNDILDGGLGNDYLNGDAGNDTFLFNPGYGKDTINAYDGTAGKVDVIQLGAGIATTDVTLTREGEDLLISRNGSSDSVRVQYYFYSDATYGYQVEQIKFNDGTTWDINTVKAKVTVGTNYNDTLYGYDTADNLSGGFGTDTLYGRGGNDTLDGGDSNDTLYGEDGNDLLKGGNQDDQLNGDNGADTLQGQNGNDTLNGGVGNDILDGGIGNDTLSGDAGDDTYIFNRGYGKDSIYAYDTNTGKVDVLQLGASIATTDVTLTRDGDDLLVSLNNSSDSVRVQYYFYSDATYGYQVEQIKFNDGTTWDINTVKAKVIAGTNSNDTLYGYNTANNLVGWFGTDTLYGRGGNDTLDGGDSEDYLYGEDGNDLLLGGNQDDYLDGGNGADTLQGQQGNDTLYGGAGNDILDGGTGNDYLSGDAGDDTFIFNRGYGKDTIYAYDSNAGKMDVIQLGAGIATTDVTLTRESDDLLISLNNSSDSVRVQSYFYNDATYGLQVEQIKFADGTFWNVDTVKEKVTAGTNFNDTLYGYNTADTLFGGFGTDTLYGRGGNDTLNGGDSEDTLYGEDGNDLLLGGNQDDYLDGGNGTDTLQGQIGADTLYGGADNDILDGGTGNDYLSGDAGDDTYLFGKGANNDTVYNYDPTSTNDRVQIGAGVTEGQVWLQRVGNDLQLTLIETNDNLTVQNWYSGAEYHVDGFNLSNGRHLEEAQVDALVSAMAAFAPPAAGQTSLPAAYQATLNPVIAANWQ